MHAKISSKISVKHGRQCLPQFTRTPRRVENMVRSGVVLMNLKVFKVFTGEIEYGRCEDNFTCLV